MAAAKKESPMFTVQLILDLGGADTPKTRNMVASLNNLTRFFSKDSKAFMGEFLNLVKSRTDELAVTIDTHAKAGTSKTTHSEIAKAPNSKPSELAEKLKDYEDKLKTANEGVRTLNAKCAALKTKMMTLNTQFVKLKNAYRVIGEKMCGIQNEATRNMIWFSEKTRIDRNQTARYEKKIIELDHDIKELKGGNVVLFFPMHPYE